MKIKYFNCFTYLLIFALMLQTITPTAFAAGKDYEHDGFKEMQVYGYNLTSIDNALKICYGSDLAIWSSLSSMVEENTITTGKTLKIDLDNRDGNAKKAKVKITYNASDNSEDIKEIDTYTDIDLENGRKTYTIPLNYVMNALGVTLFLDSYGETSKCGCEVDLYSFSIIDESPLLDTLKPTLTERDAKVSLDAFPAEDGVTYWYKATDISELIIKPEFNSKFVSDGWTSFNTKTEISAVNLVELFVQTMKVVDGKIKAWGESSVLPMKDYKHDGFGEMKVYGAYELASIDSALKIRYGSDIPEWGNVYSEIDKDTNTIGKQLIIDFDNIKGSAKKLKVRITYDQEIKEVEFDLENGRKVYIVPFSYLTNATGASLYLDSRKMTSNPEGEVDLYNFSISNTPSLGKMNPIFIAGDRFVTLKKLPNEKGLAYWYKISSKKHVGRAYIYDSKFVSAGWMPFNTNIKIPAVNDTALYVQTLTVADGKIKAWGESKTTPISSKNFNSDIVKYSVENPFHEVIPNVPDSLDWKKAPRIGQDAGMKPKDWKASTLWATFYLQNGESYVDNVGIEIKDFKQWGYSPSKKQWILLTNALPCGEFYYEDFKGNESTYFENNVKYDDHKQSATVLLNEEIQGRNYHPYSSRVDFKEKGVEDITYVISQIKARLVKWDENGPDNRKLAKYCFNVGGDWWITEDASWKSDWSANIDMACGQYREITNDWKTSYMSTVPSELYDEIVPDDLLIGE